MKNFLCGIPRIDAFSDNDCKTCLLAYQEEESRQQVIAQIVESFTIETGIEVDVVAIEENEMFSRLAAASAETLPDLIEAGAKPFWVLARWFALTLQFQRDSLRMEGISTTAPRDSLLRQPGTSTLRSHTMDGFRVSGTERIGLKSRIGRADHMGSDHGSCEIFP